MSVFTAKFPRTPLIAVPRLTRSSVGTVAAIGIAVAALAALVHRPDAYRAVIALLLVVDFFVVFMTRPRLGVVLLFLFLPFMGMLRRLLIAPAGWPAVDPIVFVAPTVIVTFCVVVFLVQRRPFAPDGLSKTL